MVQIIHGSQGNYLLSDTETINSERDILDLMGYFGEVGASLLLISEGVLHQDFFDLSTGLAGEISLKLSMYRVKTAIVADMESIPSQYFRDWAGECNRGREMRFCEDRDEVNKLVDGRILRQQNVNNVNPDFPNSIA